MYSLRKILLPLLTMAFLPGLMAHAGELRAGAAKVSITPPASEFPFTAGREKPVVGIHDEVYARALVLDDGSKRVALVMLEVTKVPEVEAIVSSVARELGVPAAQVMVAATHTHSVLSTSYRPNAPTPVHQRDLERIKQGTLDAVRQAARALQPARIAFGRGEAWVNVNNGEWLGSAKGADHSGPSDKSLDVVRVQTSAGAPLALVVNYATHAEVMFRSVTRDGGTELSGDLPGAVSRLLESQPDAAPVVLFTAGAEGDQLSMFKSLQPAGRLPATDEGAAGWALLNVMARRVAEAALEVVAGMPAGESQARLAAATGVATCPGQRTSRDAQTGKINIEAQPPVNIPLSMLRINDLVLAGIGGDVASEIGIAFKQASPVKNSTVVTVTAGATGYLLADSSYEHPGHAVFGSPLKPGCAQQAIVEGLVQLIKKNP